jgi:hypothetical protein
MQKKPTRGTTGVSSFVLPGLDLLARNLASLCQG